MADGNGARADGRTGGRADGWKAFTPMKEETEAARCFFDGCRLVNNLTHTLSIKTCYGRLRR